MTTIIAQLTNITENNRDHKIRHIITDKERKAPKLKNAFTIDCNLTSTGLLWHLSTEVVLF